MSDASGNYMGVIETLQARIAKLEAALKEAENRLVLHSSDAALLNANNDRIFKICRKALEKSE